MGETLIAARGKGSIIKCAGIVEGTELSVIIIRSSLVDASGVPHYTMSLVMDNGDTHHFFPLNDGVHYSYTLRYRGNYDEAVAHELHRPHAEIVRQWTGEGPENGDG